MLESLVRRFLYYPTQLDPNALPPPYAAGAEEVWIDTPEQNRIHALYWPAAAERPTILFFHGNAQTVFEWALIRQELAPLDCGLLLVDYPGYGKSHGEPSEPANYDAGRGAFAWLTESAGVPVGRIVVFGKSLGGGVTTEIAQEQDLLGVILESTFTSIPAVMRQLMPMLPGGGLMKSEIYDSQAKIKSIHVPVLVVHGTVDEIIPFEEGKKLFAAANEPKENYWIPGAGHNDVSYTAGAAYGQRLRAWLDALSG
ncbi:MAG: alpha/beta hydrolase [Candidatus Lernaella stagnicola]|nr:alpha/beta hydrolase [Candidatus Lernaella stagnicola]